MHSLLKLELVRESLVAVVDEMRANVIRASFSSIIYEGHDFSCALLGRDGRLVAQSLADHPIHSLAIPYSAREITSLFRDDINDGDVFLHNDPYTGGTHLNDVLMLLPVFADGELAMFAAVRCHWGDVGGMTAGSLSGQVSDIIQEGIRIVPTRVIERGVEDRAFMDLIFNNMRLPAQRRGDFKTMLGACRRAGEQIERLFRKYTRSEMLALIEEMFSRSERVLRERLRNCRSGTYFSEGYLESNGWTFDPLVARLALTIADGTLKADFTGSSPQTAGTTNCGPAIPLTAVVGVVKSFLDPSTPINHGSFAPIEVVAPRGTFIHAQSPAPCGGMAEVKYLLDAVVAAAFGQLMPEKMIGELKGTGNHVYVTGRGNSDFILYEWPAGGTGAVNDGDGNNALRGFTEGDFSSIHPVEVLERDYPIRIERSGLRVGSFGDGRHRGGLGLERDIRILSDEASLSVLSERNVIPPAGVAGGTGSAPNRFTVIRGDSEIEPSAIPGKVSGFRLRRGDVVRVQTAGGGGYGDPLDRDPRVVLSDVESGYLTEKDASHRYGLVITDGEVDGPATATLRNKLRAKRITVSLVSAPEEMFDGPRRVFQISRALADAGGIAGGDLLEISMPRGASLRGWASIDPALSEGVLLVGRSTLSMLGLGEGHTVGLRRIGVHQNG